MFEVKTTAEFDEWLTSLKDRVGKAKITARLQRLELGNAGDHAPVGDDVSELRVHSGPGYRVYYKQTDMTIIVILCGGDKSTQGQGHQASEGRGCRIVEGSDMVKLSKFDAAKYLDHPETIAAYLTEALATDDPEFICLALDTIAKAKGMTKVAKDTGLSRESLYKSLSGTTKPEFDTVRKVIGSFGLKLVAEPVDTKAT
jgi:putative addiction module killer protein/probable addiction module antidote protein